MYKVTVFSGGAQREYENISRKPEITVQGCVLRVTFYHSGRNIEIVSHGSIIVEERL